MVTKWLPIFFGCHTRADRSIFIKGKQFPICARCMGELFGIILGFILFFYWKIPIKLALLILIPLIVDGTTQLLTSYESNNKLRIVTGIFFGYGLVSLFIYSILFCFNKGYKIGQSLL